MLAMYALEGGRRALRSMFPLVSIDAPNTWIHVAYTGKWEGHAAGPFELTSKHFDEMIANFNANPNPIPLDVEHETYTPGPAPAYGWIHKLKREGSDLYAWVELSQDAARWIREGKYRFCSGVFVFGARDAVTDKDIGTVLETVALTNVPFIKGQKPILLTARNSRVGGEIMDRQKLLKLLGLEDDASDEQIRAVFDAALALDSARAGVTAEATKAEAPARAAASTPAASSAEPSAPVQADARADLLALIESMDEAEIAALLEQLMSMAGAPGPVAASGKLISSAVRATVRENRLLSETVKALSAKVGDLAKDHEKRRHEDAAVTVDALIAEHKIAASSRQDWIDEALETPERFARKANELLGHVVPKGRVALPKQVESDAALTEAQQYFVACAARTMGRDKAVKLAREKVNAAR